MSKILKLNNEIENVIDSGKAAFLRKPREGNEGGGRLARALRV
jgi:hypothetical protein